MNRIPKVAWCIGLAGISVLAGTHFATAKAPGKPPSAPVVVTFLSGDVIAAPQPLGGPFTATIDFAKHLAYPGPTGGIPGWQDLLNSLQARNPITYDSLAITNSAKGPLYGRLDFKVTIDGVPYLITMMAFLSGTTTSTATLDTMDWHEGLIRIQSGKPLKVVFEGGCYGGRPSVNFTMTK
jgi:hypothetical protein